MRKQTGFTLIELMVVMAIIAILATAGLLAYGGYIKKARDSTRIADLKAIESVVLASLSTNGSAPRLDVLIPALEEMNNGVLLEDPMKTKSVCLDADIESLTSCAYEYYPCDEYMGYAIKTRFENYGNGQSMYNSVDGDDNPTGYYQIGKCTNEQSLTGIGGIIE